MKKTFFVVFIVFAAFCACRKKDATTGHSQPVIIPDSTIKIGQIKIVNVNGANIDCQIMPPSGASFADAYLYWSTTSDFLICDSILLSSNISAATKQTAAVTDLKQNSDYYTRLKVSYKNKIFYSASKQFRTDSLQILHPFGLDTFPLHVNRDFDQNSIIYTNLEQTYTGGSPQSKIYLDNYECPVLIDNAKIITFHIPTTIPPGKYSLRLERDNMISKTPDSIFVLKDLWQPATSPNIPTGTNGIAVNSIITYGACYSETKGYMVCGRYEYNLDPASQINPNYADYPNYILEFEPSSQTWTKHILSSPEFFINPNTYYFNNSIYVIGGMNSNGTYTTLRYMFRLDLGSLAWNRLDTLPYSSVYSPISFQNNGEWYIGMGLDSAHVNTCCGEPQPTKEFWKYNPLTNQWKHLAPFPGSWQAGPTGFSLGNKAYLFLGAIPDGPGYRQELWQYDPSTDAWSQITFPQNKIPPGENYQIITFNGKILFLSGKIGDFFGSYYGFTLQNVGIEYDPSTGIFERFSNSSRVGISKLIFNQNNRFYFQAESLSTSEQTVNRTDLLIVE